MLQQLVPSSELGTTGPKNDNQSVNPNVVDVLSEVGESEEDGPGGRHYPQVTFSVTILFDRLF